MIFPATLRYSLSFDFFLRRAETRMSLLIPLMVVIVQVAVVVLVVRR